ncbi:hypothetical protein ACFQY7_17930 [Actinomadura luteofluorescens]|uniref:hypothetical protein n=1 Tax=Actinomadura luteofluorescens TaxID=46163 RepID=UPI00363926EE
MAFARHGRPARAASGEFGAGGGPGGNASQSPYTRITALDLHCTQGHQCPVTIADDGRTATGNFTVNWSFTDDIEVTLQATDDAPQQGGTFEGSIKLGDQTRPITVTILPRTQPAVTACRKAWTDSRSARACASGPSRTSKG